MQSVSSLCEYIYNWFLASRLQWKWCSMMLWKRAWGSHVKGPPADAMCRWISQQSREVSVNIQNHSQVCEWRRLRMIPPQVIKQSPSPRWQFPRRGTKEGRKKKKKWTHEAHSKSLTHWVHECNKCFFLKHRVFCALLWDSEKNKWLGAIFDTHKKYKKYKFTMVMVITFS